jgi:hypothetical protein
MSLTAFNRARRLKAKLAQGEALIANNTLSIINKETGENTPPPVPKRKAGRPKTDKD